MFHFAVGIVASSAPSRSMLGGNTVRWQKIIDFKTRLRLQLLNYLGDKRGGIFSWRLGEKRRWRHWWYTHLKKPNNKSWSSSWSSLALFQYLHWWMKMLTPMISDNSLPPCEEDFLCSLSSAFLPILTTISASMQYIFFCYNQTSRAPSLTFAKYFSSSCVSLIHFPSKCHFVIITLKLQQGENSQSSNHFCKWLSWREEKRWFLSSLKANFCLP